MLLTCKGIATMNHLREILSALKTDPRGVTALEYAMIAALIAVACVTIITSLGSNLSSVLSSVSSAL
jgi:pilus assembly protein Flp/PilA